MIDIEKHKGKRIDRVEQNAAHDHFAIYFSDGTRAAWHVEGDCCSESWIEHLDAPNNIKGAELLGVEESESASIDHPVHDCLQVYWTSFRTSNGSIVLEYRNSSNGYYGGYLTEDPS